MGQRQKYSNIQPSSQQTSHWTNDGSENLTHIDRQNQTWNTKKIPVHLPLSGHNNLSSVASTEALTRAVSQFHNTDYSLVLDQNESVIKEQLAFHSWNPELNPTYEREALSDTCWSNWRTTATSNKCYTNSKSIKRHRAWSNMAEKMTVCGNETSFFGQVVLKKPIVPINLSAGTLQQTLVMSHLAVKGLTLLMPYLCDAFRMSKDPWIPALISCQEHCPVYKLCVCVHACECVCALLCMCV